MAMDLHFICSRQQNHQRLEGTVFETGNSVVSNETADEAIGGRVYLHEKKKEELWHGGTIVEWRRTDDGHRKIFRYVVDGPFRLRCPGGWGQEKAIVRRE